MRANIVPPDANELFNPSGTSRHEKERKCFPVVFGAMGDDPRRTTADTRHDTAEQTRGCLDWDRGIFHVGHLDLAYRTSWPSLEADMLSVSLDPDDWRYRCRFTGSQWTLRCDGALWLDAHALDAGMCDALRKWGIAQGHAKAAAIYRMWAFDLDEEQWRNSGFETLDRAGREVDENEDPAGDPPTTGALPEPVSGCLLTPQAAALRRTPWLNQIEVEKLASEHLSHQTFFPLVWSHSTSARLIISGRVGRSFSCRR